MQAQLAGEFGKRHLNVSRADIIPDGAARFAELRGIGQIHGQIGLVAKLPSPNYGETRDSGRRSPERTAA